MEKWAWIHRVSPTVLVSLREGGNGKRLLWVDDDAKMSLTCVVQNQEATLRRTMELCGTANDGDGVLFSLEATTVPDTPYVFCVSLLLRVTRQWRRFE